MDRQTLRDWVIRYNAEGIAGLRDQPKSYNPEKRSSSEEVVLLARIFQTPNPAHDGVCAWTLADHRPGVATSGSNGPTSLVPLRPIPARPLFSCSPKPTPRPCRSIWPTLPKNTQAVMVFDQAGWYGAKELKAPDNVTLIALLPYGPELNPVERLWLYLRERFQSLRVFDDHDAIIDACCQAGNVAADDAERIKPLCLQPWIRKAFST